MKQDSTVELIGIFSNKNLFLDKYPQVRVFNKQSGYYSIPLTKNINCQTDVLLKIRGKIINVPQKFPMINKVSYHKHLLVISFEILNDIKSIKRIVGQEYQKIRDNLQNKITPSGSKLQLSNAPDWDIWFNGAEGKLIFTNHQYDLMYAADIEFVVNKNSEKIIDIYAREWFKGEL